jgi:hypothetical protein
MAEKMNKTHPLKAQRFSLNAQTPRRELRSSLVTFATVYCFGLLRAIFGQTLQGHQATYAINRHHTLPA